MWRVACGVWRVAEHTSEVQRMNTSEHARPKTVTARKRGRARERERERERERALVPCCPSRCLWLTLLEGGGGLALERVVSSWQATRTRKTSGSADRPVQETRAGAGAGADTHAPSPPVAPPTAPAVSCPRADAASRAVLTASRPQASPARMLCCAPALHSMAAAAVTGTTNMRPDRLLRQRSSGGTRRAPSFEEPPSFTLIILTALAALLDRYLDTTSMQPAQA